jgi:hypothetical protein
MLASFWLTSILKFHWKYVYYVFLPGMLLAIRINFLSNDRPNKEMNRDTDDPF